MLVLNKGKFYSIRSIKKFSATQSVQNCVNIYGLL